MVVFNYHRRRPLCPWAFICVLIFDKDGRSFKAGDTNATKAIVFHIDVRFGLRNLGFDSHTSTGSFAACLSYLGRLICSRSRCLTQTFHLGNLLILNLNKTAKDVQLCIHLSEVVLGQKSSVQLRKLQTSKFIGAIIWSYSCSKLVSANGTS